MSPLRPGVPQTQVAIPTREPADYKFTARQSDWSGGWDRLKYSVSGQPTEPRFWDSFNVDTTTEGEIKLAALFEIVDTDASDTKSLLENFNNAGYKLPGIVSPQVKKSADGVTWNNVAMASGPATAITAKVMWRNNLFVAASHNSIYRLTTGDVWSAITPPTGVTDICDAVGVSPDDKLMAWFKNKGLYQTSVLPPAAGDWAKVWPPTTDPDEPNCSFLDGSTGTVLVATYDDKGSSLHEYFTAEGAATAASMVTWMSVSRLFLYVSRLYDDAAYIGGKYGVSPGATTNGQGILYRKERGQKPQPVMEFGDGIRGAVASQDFGIRALVSDESYLWIGAPSRAANLSAVVGVPTVYRYSVDEQGVENNSPDAATDESPGGVAGKVYGSIIIDGHVIISTNKGLWRRSPTKKAAQGYLDTSLFDLQAEDHLKIWRFTELQIEDATATETVQHFYRTGTLTGSWLGGTTVTASGAKKIDYPDTAAAQGKYRLWARQIQHQYKLSRGATTTLTPRITSTAIDAAQILPVETTS